MLTAFNRQFYLSLNRQSTVYALRIQRLGLEDGRKKDSVDLVKVSKPCWRRVSRESSRMEEERQAPKLRKLAIKTSINLAYEID